MSHQTITLEQYLGPYKDHPQMQSTVLLANAEKIIAAMNQLCWFAEADGVELEDNPDTGNAIGGQGNGGARPHDATVGAPLSAHKTLTALDRYDLNRQLMRWALSSGWSRLAELGIYIEHPQWTRSWLHGQITPPASHARVFVPYSDLAKYPPTCAPLPEQYSLAEVAEFSYRQKTELA